MCYFGDNSCHRKVSCLRLGVASVQLSWLAWVCHCPHISLRFGFIAKSGTLLMKISTFQTYYAVSVRQVKNFKAYFLGENLFFFELS